jgi:hypothetical protein
MKKSQLTQSLVQTALTRLLVLAILTLSLGFVSKAQAQDAFGLYDFGSSLNTMPIYAGMTQDSNNQFALNQATMMALNNLSWQITQAQTAAFNNPNVNLTDLLLNANTGYVNTVTNLELSLQMQPQDPTRMQPPSYTFSSDGGSNVDDQGEETPTNVYGSDGSVFQVAGNDLVAVRVTSTSGVVDVISMTMGGLKAAQAQSSGDTYELISLVAPKVLSM